MEPLVLGSQVYPSQQKSLSLFSPMYKLPALLQAEKPALFLCSQLLPVGAYLNSGFAARVPEDIGGWTKPSTSSLWQGEEDEHPMLRMSPLGICLGQDLLTYLPKPTAWGRRLQGAKVNQG